MLELGIIERSDSAWSSPILMVLKDDGRWQILCLFEKTVVTKKNAYLQLLMISVLDKVGNARYFSTRDIKSACWHIIYWLVDKTFGPELKPFVFKYLDDFIAVTPDLDTYLRIIEKFLKKVAGFLLNRNKCIFCRDELKFLGYVKTCCDSKYVYFKNFISSSSDIRYDFME